jgi:4-hydroxy-3-methylbut-2-enyl diphosphate reductase
MIVTKAKTAGFCMGVDLALRKLDAAVQAKQAAPLFTLGPIIHNPQVLEAYRAKGVEVANSPEQIPVGAKVVIRAHGVPCQVEKDLAERSIEVLDATCPKVKKAQLSIGSCASDGRIMLLFGEENHPEVKGLVSYASSGAFVFGSREELDHFKFMDGEAYCLAAQTTQDKAVFLKISEELKQCPDKNVQILHTICNATRNRQEEAIQLAKDVDFVVVVGGFESGNTRRLAQVVSDTGTPAMHIETVKDIEVGKLKGVTHVGLTAGASTPGKIIDEVEHFLKGLEL